MTKSGSPLRSRLLAGAAAVGLTLVTAASAAAGPLTDPPARPGDDAPWRNGSQVRVKTMNTGGGGACSFIASPNSLGGVCVRANGLDGPTIRETLGGEPLPTCWTELLDETELKDINLVNGENERWYWYRCLEGIDPETYEIGPEGISFAIGIWAFVDGDPRIVELTPNQQVFVDRFVSRGNVPEPVLLASPNPMPLVNQDVAFYNYGDSAMHVDMSIPGVAMRGKITETLVYPEGRPGKPVRCSGPGVQAEEGDTPQTLRDACWHLYRSSSLTQADDYFAAEIHVKWQVDVFVRGAWQPFHSFTKAAEAMIPVNEVQALVQP